MLDIPTDGLPSGQFMQSSPPWPPMKILYVTASVLGDSGANAAEIFPRLAAQTPRISHVYVADYHCNRDFIRDQQHAEFLKLRRQGGKLRNMFRNAARIAKKSKDNDINVIHIFYRQSNILLIILLRMALLYFGARAIIIVDHRSVNLARGFRSIFKKSGNLVMQVFTHCLAGNPWAVETNHFFIFKPKRIIDLGYDKLPDGQAVEPQATRPAVIWFIGSLKPKNRKSEFLIRVFDLLNQQAGKNNLLEIHVAGPARIRQANALRKNPIVTYYGRLPRPNLYRLLRRKPGIGIAFMNTEFHAFAPSLKFCEYAIMRFKIVTSDTLGLRIQASRMNLDGVVFAKETPEEWVTKLIAAATSYRGLEPTWQDADLWSYDSIFERQVIDLYDEFTHRKA